MRIIRIETVNGQYEIAVEENQIIFIANILETSKAVASFFVEGLNVPKQQWHYGTAGYSKWISPIQQ